MADHKQADDRRRREPGEKTLREVYAGDVVVPPGEHPFTDVMLKQLFAELRPRDALAMRDKRIPLLGVIAEKGEPATFKAQTKASLKRGEMRPEEARELLLFIAQRSGCPRAAAILGPMEEAVAEFEKEQAERKTAK